MPSLQHLLLGVFLLLLLIAPGHQASADKDPELQRILKAHVDAMGGWRAWNKVESIRLTGTIEREGQTYDFCIIKKRPDFIRSTFTIVLPGSENEQVQFIHAFNGKSGWKASRIKGSQKIEREELSTKEVAELAIDGRIEPILIHLWQNGVELEVAEPMDTNEEVITIRTKGPPNENSYIFCLSSKTHKIVRYTRIHNTAEGHTTNIAFQEYIETSGIILPSKVIVDSFKTGRSEIKTESAIVGIGIYDEYFSDLDRY